MSISLDYTAELQAGDDTYRVTARSKPAGEDGPPHVEIELDGNDATGQATAHGTLALPTGGLGAAARLLHQILTALSALHSTVGGSLGARPTNAQALWSQEDDAELRRRWLAATGRPTTVRRELADHFGRSTNSIRSRLLRIRCDPDSPGRMLTDEPERD